MNVVDTAKQQAKQLAHKVVEKVGEKVTADSRVQAITIARPRAEVLDLFQDPERLSRIFGDIADVTDAGADRLRWTFAGDDGPVWDCVVSREGDNRLRYVDVNPERAAGLTLDFSDAPGDRGTEVVARVTAPGPGALTGVLTFKALYRARALLQTGEVPTIARNPSARDSSR
ncbi:hypothetical protein AFM11_02255 [Mycolicibacterium wolinskyi]|uniref:Cyclase n=1 Tax=Mycolicibacterium wolinskyi TaxID=59750 RepID=A0A132PV98_9MYCO|nr:hypothetical protein [Mycolicibacterium wolinskyi]KWX26087.1 hypothetical protein AFM11_02255 [Mycolicibacterium wolinskyi]